MNPTTFTVGEDKKTLIVERDFPAPKSRVWDAYSKPELLAKWWGPKGWETEIKHMDFSVGGYWHYCMRCVDKAQGDFYGMESWGMSTYTAIAPQDSISYDDAICTEEQQPNPNMPVSHTTLTLKESGG
ncbi:MAG: SRPBCC domain-containing protein, partial [Gammaproteobacteria bacterium]